MNHWGNTQSLGWNCRVLRDMIVECPFTHLTSFVVLGRELTGALISANYELFYDTFVLEDYDSCTSLRRLYIYIFILAFILCLSFGASFVVACAIMFIYLYLNFCIKKGKRKKNLRFAPLLSEFENRGRRCILC